MHNSTASSKHKTKKICILTLLTKNVKLQKQNFAAHTLQSFRNLDDLRTQGYTDLCSDFAANFICKSTTHRHADNRDVLRYSQ